MLQLVSTLQQPACQTRLDCHLKNCYLTINASVNLLDTLFQWLGTNNLD